LIHPPHASVKAAAAAEPATLLRTAHGEAIIIIIIIEVKRHFLRKPSSGLFYARLSPFTPGKGSEKWGGRGRKSNDS
jgi:hypothetical protein